MPGVHVSSILHGQVPLVSIVVPFLMLRSLMDIQYGLRNHVLRIALWYGQRKIDLC